MVDRSLFRTVLSGLLLVTVSASAGAQGLVAKVRVENTAGDVLRNVVVRGAMPLPPDYDRPIGCLTLRSGGKEVPAQVSVLSTYAGSDAAHPVGRPEVVQLSVRVPSLPAGFSELEVVERPDAPQAGAVGPGKAVAGWLSRKAAVLVEATDCFGHRYSASVLQAVNRIETRQSGPVLTEEVYQAILTPVGKADDPAKPALKQFLRVRAYLTTYAGEDFASLALMIHNGSVDHPNGDVYYRQIRVGVPSSMGMMVWKKRFSPASGAEAVTEEGTTWQPCPPAEDGKVFVMPARGAAVLRTFVHAPDAAKRAALYADHQPLFVPAASQELFSWSNFRTARYSAGNYPVPMSLPKEDLDKYHRIVQRQWTNPELSYLSKPPKGVTLRMGHAIPAGVPYGGMTGGAGVQYAFGLEAIVTASAQGLRLHVLLADRNWDRQRAHRFYDDGRPYTYGRGVVEADGKKFLDVPVDARGWPRETPADPACAVQAKHVKDNKLLHPAAEALQRYMNHDDQHLCRVFDAAPAAYLACDPVNRDRLVTLAGQVCEKLNIHPYKARPSFGGYGSLHEAWKNVSARPGAGVGFGRANGWLNHALAAGFYLSQDKQIRRDCADVACVDVAVREKAQMPAGNVTVHQPYSKTWDGGYWYVNAWQTVGIMGHGARCLAGVLDSPEDRDFADRLKKVYARVGTWSATVGWNANLNAPAGNVGLRRKGENEPLEKPYMDAKKSGGTNHYFGNAYLWYYELTGNELFLERLRQTARGNVAAASAGMMPNWSYCLWLAQGGKIPERKGF